MRHPVLITTLTAGAIALSACSGNAETQQATGANQGPDPEDVVARVNGQPISAVALDAQVQAQSSRGQPVQRPQALDELVDLTVLAQEAEAQGLPEQPEIAAQLARQRAAVLAQHLVRAELSSFSPSEDELRQAYQDRVEQTSGQEYKASHILLEEEAKANEMIAQLDEGADFANLAREHSTGPTSNRGGSLGWFQPDQMVGPFAQAVQALAPGSYTEAPVKTRFGWHVVRLEDVREAQQPAFEEIRDQLRNQLVSRHVQDYITRLREQADVEIIDASLEPGGTSEATPAAAEEAAEAAADGDGGDPGS
ncbi:MAG: peptidylprolyl isomerase [Halofilum sp. (in: g-proteobacteria)]|nr:peptidylprolyl isomerase [Halofilum sp. (in: g-proteobacteria)]